MERFGQFIKTWGGFTLVAIFVAILVMLFIISECKIDSTFLRVIYGVPTLMPAGILTAWLCKRGLDNIKE